VGCSGHDDSGRKLRCLLGFFLGRKVDGGVIGKGRNRMERIRIEDGEWKKKREADEVS
jgi:hypothetical protein